MKRRNKKKINNIIKKGRQWTVKHWRLLAVAGVACLSVSVLLSFLQDTNALPRDMKREAILTPIGDLTVRLDDKDSIQTIQIGEDVDREITVTNKGTTKQFVRVMLFPTMETSNGLTTHLTTAELMNDLNTTDWQDGKDGYYYYLKALKAGEKTPQLVSQFKVPSTKEAGELYLTVKAEATTAAGNEYRHAFWGKKDAPTALPLKEIDEKLNPQRDRKGE